MEQKSTVVVSSAPQGEPRFEVIEPPAEGRVAGWIEILGVADPGKGGMVTYMLL